MRSRFRPMGAAQIAATNALMATNEAPPVKAQRRPIIDVAAVRRAEREALAQRRALNATPVYLGD